MNEELKIGDKVKVVCNDNQAGILKSLNASVDGRVIISNVGNKCLVECETPPCEKFLDRQGKPSRRFVSRVVNRNDLAKI